MVLVVGSGTVACSSTDAPDQRSSATVPATVAVPAGTAPPSTAAPVVTTTRVPVPGPTDPGGAGDPYFPLLGNGGYDVARYDLALRVDPRVDVLDQHPRAHHGHRDRHARDVSPRPRGAHGSFGHRRRRRGRVRRDGEELVVTPPQPIAAGSTFVTALDYAGVPEPVLDAEGTRLGWLRAGGTTYVVSEPNGAHGWLASNDHPTDKALFRFRIDVPEGITAAANGRLVSSTTENGRTVWEWQTAEPMATYLATIAIGSFTIVDGGTTKGVRIRHVLPTRSRPQLSASIAGTPQMIDVLTSIFGPFPFSDYGVLAIDARLGFALETQTLSLFDRTILAGGNSAAIQVHELAHQWFGNSVSIRSWRDIWLTEGFATYTESLWRERTERGFDIDAAMRATGAYQLRAHR